MWDKYYRMEVDAQYSFNYVYEVHKIIKYVCEINPRVIMNQLLIIKVNELMRVEIDCKNQNCVEIHKSDRCKKYGRVWKLSLL